MSESENQRTQKNTLKSRKDFEWDSFLLLSYRLAYRHQRMPAYATATVKRLKERIRLARKGNRRRGRGNLIRFGKFVIYALYRNRPEDISQLWNYYTTAARNASSKQSWRSQTDYGWTEKRARRSWAIVLEHKKLYPSQSRLPEMTKQPNTEEISFIPRQFRDTREVDQTADFLPEMQDWHEPFVRPAEDVLNVLLNNKCDDNVPDTDDDIRTDLPTPPKPLPPTPGATGKIEQPDLFGVVPPPEPKKIASQRDAYRRRSKYAHLFIHE